MKKHTERLPIDDLFARKLGNMSLPPSSDGFERLQARLGQTTEKPKVVFWRNPDSYRYMAAAACLLLVCLFGWLYWPSGDPAQTDRNSVASNKRIENHKLEQPSSTRMGGSQESRQAEKADNPVIDETAATDQLAQASSPTKGRKGIRNDNREVNTANAPVELTRKLTGGSVAAQTTPGKPSDKIDSERLATNSAASSQPTSSDQPIVAAVKPAPATERVLIVTIAEPEALVAARQAAKTAIEEKTALAANDKSEKENKSPNIWQQVKRFKQGDVFARGDKDDSESGLLGKAYSGIKHSFEKDKAVKQ
ncbi:hypothetical protein M0L20_09755 [Spirosoma sp. RP8]|uniref:Uncharacterized protein n=1 Tax=Spirosoma liriopis TaxID=2937440 RepID=A0ABT0HIY7_9BACT|nr:hypothetical protein [Spirosoma liriopis]MCK8492131.1 hypothetical protein [Spirosoma liriopis]